MSEATSSDAEELAFQLEHNRSNKKRLVPTEPVDKTQQIKNYFSTLFSKFSNESNHADQDAGVDQQKALIASHDDPSRRFAPLSKSSTAGVYSAEEWIIILSHSAEKDESLVPPELQLTIDHLSLQRVYESFLFGAALCEHLRGPIWRLICKVHYQKQQYNFDLY